MPVTENVTLRLGDCLDLMAEMEPGSVDMVLCNPPQEVSAKNPWDVRIPFDRLWEGYRRVCKPEATIVLFSAGMFTADLMESNPEMWRYNLVWEKTAPTGFLNAGRAPLRAHEDIVVFYGRQPKYNPQMTRGHAKKSVSRVSRMNSEHSANYGSFRDPADYESTERFPRSVLRFPRDTQTSALHPTQKPVALCSWLIRTYTDRGDLVLDSCMGSGSVGVAAVMEGRRFVGFEADERYFRIAEDRIGRATEVLRTRTTLDSFGSKNTGREVDTGGGE